MSEAIVPSSWCEIHLDRISRNLELALGLLPEGADFCAVVKSDAYGHGIDKVVPLLLEQGVKVIGITSNAEARAVREAGFVGRLIRLRAATLQEITAALADKVEEQVGSLWAAKQQRELLASGRSRVGVHLSLNSNGMSRDGLEISTEVGQQNCREILQEIGQNIVGICTHFPSNKPALLKQSSDLFKQQVNWVFDNSKLNRSGIVIHAGSTLTLLSGEAVESDMYRCGAILYGILSPELGFRPTMELKSRVVHLGDYPEGSTVGYDRDSRLSKDQRLACISIGYAAGYHRVAQNQGAVLIRGRSAPILGKISMNSIVANVTEIPNVQIGDEVTLFGGEGELSIEPQNAIEQFETIMPDLLVDWGIRNSRVYR